MGDNMALKVINKNKELNSNTNTWYLIPVKEDDSGYKDTFTLYYERDYLGDIKVFYPGKIKDKNLVNDIKERIKNKSELWFIPVDTLMHTNLAFLMNAFEDMGMDLNWYLNQLKLNKLFDIFYFKDKFDTNENQFSDDLLTKSIFREDNHQHLKSALDLCKLGSIYDLENKFSIIDFLNPIFYERNIGDKLFEQKKLNFLKQLLNKLDSIDRDSFYLTIGQYLSKNPEKANEVIIEFLHKIFNEEDNDELRACLGQIINKDLRKVISDVVEIRNYLKVDRNKIPDNSLGQYTSVSTLKYLINRNKTNKPCLRLTNSNQMNDPLEGKALRKFLGLTINSNTDYIKSNEFVSSASATLDSLPMWKQYGNDAKGLCLVYDNEYLNELLDLEKTDVKLFRVAYFEEGGRVLVSKFKGESSQEVKNISNKILKKLEDIKVTFQKIKYKKYKKIGLKVVSSIFYLFKSLDYAYENEFRILMKMDTKKEDQVKVDIVDEQYLLHTYTVDKKNHPIIIKYSKVILGPKAVDIDYIAPYIKLCQPDIKVIKSGIHYR